MGASASRMQEARHSRLMVTRLAATATALALLTVPVPAGADGPSRTVLIAASESVSLSALAEQVGRLGGRVVQTLGIADSLLVELPAGVGAPAGSAEVPDVPMRVNGARTQSTATLPTYRETIGADLTGTTATGRGTTVALVDTGVADIPMLADVEHINVTEAPTRDGLGHGTFLAGLIAGAGDLPGVAPEAQLVDVKVADDDGRTSLSLVLAGLQAVADRRDVDVVNLSLSTGSPLPPGFDPLTRALDRLWRSGITVVTAAGNEGPDEGTVTSPGTDPVLITVGSLDESGTGTRDDDTVAAFSSRGTEHSTVKPDLVAPGVSLISTAAPDSAAVIENPGSLVAGGYMRGSGTSMSAAVVTGAVAAILSVNPRLRPNGVKSLLMSTAYSSADLGSDDGAGSGALDLAAAAQDARNTSNAASHATHNQQGTAGDWGPAESDAEAWAAFAAAWEAGDLEAVRAAWDLLSWQTKQWAARSWSMAVVASGLGLPASDFAARSWSARSWSLDEWLARSWSARSWSELDWTFEEWLARSWSGLPWSARSWSARSWSADEWLARSWSARSWSMSDWAARSWSARSWSARSWSARSWSDLVWEARSWSARSWSARSWSARSWSRVG